MNGCVLMFHCDKQPLSSVWCWVSLSDMFQNKRCFLFQAEFTGSPAPDTLPSTDFNCSSAPEVLNQSSPPTPRLAKQDLLACLSISIIVQLAPCLLPLLCSHSGSPSLATAFPVARASYPPRVPASRSGAPLYLLVQLLPTPPPQVISFFCFHWWNMYCFCLQTLWKRSLRFDMQLS